ncbi:MAG: hypothetical protein GQ536_07390 [Candidatus Aminicenantes bacterium]|nr:hypothetical protein [Candidatus Aminicenantes bacterium]
MRCELIEELLSPYLEDELDQKEKRAVKEHLKTCKNCSLLFSYIRETRKSLTGFPEMEVSENLLDRLYSIPGKKKRFKLSFDFLFQPSLQPLLAAVTILVMVVSFYSLNPDRNRINKSISRQAHLSYSKVGKLYARAETFVDALGEHKDNILVSVKNIPLFGGNED